MSEWYKMQEFPPKVYFQTSKISFNKNKNEFQNNEGGLEGNLWHFLRLWPFNSSGPSCLTARQVLWCSDLKERHWLCLQCVSSSAGNSRGDVCVCACECVCVLSPVGGNKEMLDCEPTEFTATMYTISRWDLTLLILQMTTWFVG